MRRELQLQQVLDQAHGLALDREELLAAQVADLQRQMVEVDLGVQAQRLEAAQRAGLVAGPGVEVGS